MILIPLILLILIITLLWKLRHSKIHLIFTSLILIFGSLSFIFFFLPFNMGPESGSYVGYTTTPKNCPGTPSLINPFGLKQKKDQTQPVGLSTGCYSTFSSESAPVRFYVVADIFIITLFLYLLYIFYKTIDKIKRWLKFKKKNDPNFFKFKLK